MGDRLRELMGRDKLSSSEPTGPATATGEMARKSSRGTAMEEVEQHHDHHQHQHHHHPQHNAATNGNVDAHGRPKLRRGNSTNSVVIQNTINDPAVPQLLHSLGVYFHQQLAKADLSKLAEYQRAQRTPQANIYFDAFDETFHPLSFKVHNCIRDDRVDHHAVETWIKDIYRLGELQPECIVLSRAFFDRMVNNRPEFIFCTHTWRRSTLACLILASKIWEDMAVWNADFLGLIPRSDGHDLAVLEKILLRALEFNIEFSAGQYAKLYFELRDIGRHDADTCEMAGDDNAIDEDVQAKLADRVSLFQAGLAIEDDQ